MQQDALVERVGNRHGGRGIHCCGERADRDGKPSTSRAALEMLAMDAGPGTRVREKSASYLEAVHRPSLKGWSTNLKTRCGRRTLRAAARMFRVWTMLPETLRMRPVKGSERGARMKQLPCLLATLVLLVVQPAQSQPDAV